MSSLCTQAIWIELTITLGISFFAVYENAYKDKSDVCSGMLCFPTEPIGHQIVGTLLAFLVVFRSQIAFNMYMDGRNQFQRYMSASTLLCQEILGCLAHQANELHAEDAVMDAMFSKVDAHVQRDSVRPGTATRNDAALDDLDDAMAAPINRHTAGDTAPVPTDWIGNAVGAAAATKIRDKMAELNVDAGLLAMLDQQGWQELGVESGVLRAKLERAARAQLAAQPKMSPASRRRKNIELAFFSQEIVRLTKLCFFCVLEHTRSTCGDTEWQDLHDMVNIFATDAEESEFNCLFGLPENQKGKRQQVPVKGHDEKGQPLQPSVPNMPAMAVQARIEVGVR